MNLMTAARSVCALVLLAGSAGAWDVPDRVAAVCAAYDHYDRNHDGELEINRLAPLGGEFAKPSARPTSGGLVVLLVEPRLARAGATPDLRAPLATWVGDLSAEGFDVVALEAGVYAGPRHQDGLTVLALRDVLIALSKAGTGLRAVELVGAFPDAFLVRRYAWWHHEPVTLNQGKPGQKAYAQPVDYLRWVPEPVSFRFDLVLGDLDGHWDELYHGPRESMAYHYLTFPQGRARAAEGAEVVESGTLPFEDFFLSDDDPIALSTNADGKTVQTVTSPGNAECTADDLKLPNPLARPELWVSRLDARHAAVIPDPNVTDAAGHKLLDAQGQPQTLTFADAAHTPHPHQIWSLDESSERAMLRDWLDHRHRFRLGEYAAARKPANIGTGWGSAVHDCQAAFAEWKTFNEPGYDILRDNVNLLEVVQWLARPAQLRAMKAHGDPWGCEWAKAPDPAALDTACGPRIFNWQRQGNKLMPTLAGTPSKLDFAVTRSLYESGKAPEAPALWLYTSCEGTAPEGGGEQPYNAPRYGFWQGSECILFHLRGLALIGRSKVFYDEPRDMWPTLARGGTMGDVWRHYLDVEAAEGALRQDNGIGCKRSYFWNVVGDCTVRVATAG